MAFSNLDYLYEHLPARYRRADTELFLKRFLQWFGEELDEVDRKYETFFEQVNADTATEEFIDFWLYALFGWTWFPAWFTLNRKREFYKFIGRHYAKRGTAEGIQELLAAFGVTAYVQARPLIWGEFVWGENLVSMSGPLGISVAILPKVEAVNEDLSYWGEFVWGEGALVSPGRQLQSIDVDALLRFEQPLATVMMVETLPLTPPVVVERFSLLLMESSDVLLLEDGEILEMEAGGMLAVAPEPYDPADAMNGIFTEDDDNLQTEDETYLITE